MAGIIDRIEELYRSGSADEAERFMLESRDAILADEAGDKADLIVVCNELGGLYREASRYADSIENFELALGATEELLGMRDCEEYATILLNIAGTYRYMRAFDEALARYRQSCEIFERLGLDDTYEYASLLNNVSLAYQDMGRYGQALEKAEASHEIIVDLKPGQVQEAISLMNLATLALRAGDMDTASSYSRQAIDIYAALDSTSGHYPAAVNLAAVIDFKRGALEEALAGFERSAELTKRNFGINRDYVSALGNMAAVLDRLGRGEEARDKLAEAAGIREHLG